MITSSDSPQKQPEHSITIPPSSPHIALVTESAAKIGVTFKPQEANPMQAPGVLSFTVEEMILKVKIRDIGTTIIIYK